MNDFGLFCFVLAMLSVASKPMKEPSILSYYSTIVNRNSYNKAVRDGLNIIVLYNAATIDKSKCPDGIKDHGNHVAMQKMENGTRVWDYEAVKKAMGQ